MEKEFLPYNLALRMKALSYKEKVLTYYENGVPKLYNDILGWDFNSSFLTCCSRPTFQSAFNWFREKYNINTYITSKTLDNGNVVFIPNGRTIPDTIKNGFIVDIIRYMSKTSYREAEIACLEELIEIVEQKQLKND